MTILGKILRGAAIGVGSVLSLVAPGVGGAIISAVGNVKKTVDSVTKSVDNSISTAKLPAIQTPTTLTSTGTGFVFTAPMWIIVAVVAFLIIKPLKILR